MQQMQSDKKEKQITSKYIIAIIGAFLLGMVIVGVPFILFTQRHTTSDAAASGAFKSAQKDGNQTVLKDEADIADIVNHVGPSVVSIVTSMQADYHFFTAEQQGAGTGVIISPDGYILTNKHVIGSASKVTIFMSDGRQFTDVNVVGADPMNDVAFLKINGAKDLPAATIGDSGTVRVGQHVVAIGNSLGQYQNTVTSGIISGKGRPIEAQDEATGSIERLNDLLQTDAAINPGNSGGPLINMSGQVIGINTAVVSDAQSMGFAIPINAAKGAMKTVLRGDGVQKAYLGVRYINVTPAVQTAYKLPSPEGAYVYAGDRQDAVEPGGPADKAGVKKGDIITQIDDKKIGEQGSLASIISEYTPQEKVTLTVLRSNKELKLEATLTRFKAQ